MGCLEADLRLAWPRVRAYSLFDLNRKRSVVSCPMKTLLVLAALFELHLYARMRDFDVLLQLKGCRFIAVVSINVDM